MLKRLLTVFLFVIAGTMLAHAGRIEISEPQCQEGDIFLGPADISGFVFAPTNGGGSLTFCNNTGVDWTKLTIAIRTSDPLSSVICPSASGSDPLNQAHLAFSTCLVSNNGPEQGIIYVRLFGVDPPDPLNNPGYYGFPGVPNGNQFTINLNCAVADELCQPWAADTFMVAAANNNFPHVPEPASFAMLGSALIAGLLRRKISR